MGHPREDFPCRAAVFIFACQQCENSLHAGIHRLYLRETLTFHLHLRAWSQRYDNVGASKPYCRVPYVPRTLNIFHYPMFAK